MEELGEMEIMYNESLVSAARVRQDKMEIVRNIPPCENFIRHVVSIGVKLGLLMELHLN
jgi:deoxycytidylate deaminase